MDLSQIGLSPDEMKALEATRNRLYQLTNSIGSLMHDMNTSYPQPLPNPTSLQASASILQQNLAYLLDLLNDNSAVFQRVVVHPSTNFPGRTHQDLIDALLRKKLDPDIETSVDEGRDVALAAGISEASFATKARVRAERERERLAEKEERRRIRAARYQTDESDEEGSSDDDDGADDIEAEVDAINEPEVFGDFWADSQTFFEERMKEFREDEFKENFTAAEREMGVENVRTGLRRQLDDEYESDEEDEDGQGDATMQDDVQFIRSTSILPAAIGTSLGEDPERMLWYASRGDDKMPPNIEMEKQRIARESTQKRGLR